MIAYEISEHELSALRGVVEQIGFVETLLEALGPERPCDHVPVKPSHISAFLYSVTAPLEKLLGQATERRTKMLSAALGLQAGADEATALSATTTLKAGDSTTLSAQINDRSITELVDGAIASHKLLPVQREWAMGLGKANVAALNGYLALAQPIPGLGGQGGAKDLAADSETTTAVRRTPEATTRRAPATRKRKGTAQAARR